MLKQLKNLELARMRQLVELMHKLDPRTEVVAKPKKNYTWLIVIVSIVAAVGVGFAVYKFCFKCKDGCENYDEDDFDDIDFEEDFEEDFETYDKE